MAAFWDESWANVDQNRVKAYLQKSRTEPDEMIRYLHTIKAKTVCDAGCGCGAYAMKLAANGFEVCGFDVAAPAVELAQNLLQDAGIQAELKVASVLSTGYGENRFDCVLSRDVLDHMTKQEAKAALKELVRITKAGGSVIVTVDFADEEYKAEPHTVNQDGDFCFTAGKWSGMVFHPYSAEELQEIMPEGVGCVVKSMPDGLYMELTKGYRTE